MRRMGIDVSENQSIIDWEKVKAAGVQFAILRTVKRSGKVDAQLAANIEGCRRHGISVGYYLHSYALTEEAGRKEAVAVVNALKELNVTPDKKIVIWHDIEWDTQMELSTEKLTAIVKAFKEVIVESGFSFGLYMGKYDFEKGEVNLKALGESHVWLARYYDGYKTKTFGEEPNEKYVPTVPDGALCGWQWTSSGRVPGINGNVDLDVMYCDLGEENGDTADSAEEDHEETFAKENPYKEPTKLLYRGKSGMNTQDIKWLQFELVRTGYLDLSYVNSKGEKVDSVDGFYGKLTDTAVEEFQKAHPATYTTKNPDKKVGSKTRAALKQAESK